MEPRENWFTEFYGDAALMIKVRKKIFEGQTEFQHMQIFDTEFFGKLLVLDGKVQLTERDEGFYHEMLVHVPMFTHPNPRKVLIIGGGDGGSVREALKHNPDEIVMVEIDRKVVEFCREYIGVDKGALNDSRVTVLYEDGIEFVKSTNERFDVLIVDGTDPNPVSKSLVMGDFYEACARISDVFATQSQTPFIQQEYFRLILENTRGVFLNRRVYLGYVPTYPFGLWSYLLASNRDISLDGEEITQRYVERGVETVYYTPTIHVSSFVLPKWVADIVNAYS
jgi:spermidine synthase